MHVSRVYLARLLKLSFATPGFHSPILPCFAFVTIPSLQIVFPGSRFYEAAVPIIAISARLFR